MSKTAKCNRTINGKQCGYRKVEHAGNGCPEDPTKTFLEMQSKHRASGSFSREELLWAERFFATARRGGDVSIMLRADVGHNLMTRIKKMLESIEARSKGAE